MEFHVRYSRPAQINTATLEAEMLNHPQETAPVVHRFGPGIYIREVTLPKGAFAIGHRQIYEHLNIMLKGRVRMLDGNLLEAPLIFVGQPGKKAGWIEEETVWLNVYATNETDTQKLEAMFLEKSEAFTSHQMPAVNTANERADYLKMLVDLGVTEELVRHQSEDPSDQIPMPYGSYLFQIAPSPIQGNGVFACGDIARGDTIGPARIKSLRTPLGRYTNHSGTPNAEMVARDGRIDLVAIVPISGNCGGWLGDEITVDYRHSVEVACQA